MNVLYVNHYAGGPRYGMEYRPYYLGREWVRSGHRVTIVAASHSHVRARQPAMNGRFTTETTDGVQFVWCATPRYHGNGFGRVVNILGFLRRLGQWRTWLAEKPDVVIASSTYPLDIVPARRIARAHGATLVWEVHDLWPLSPIELGGISPRHPFMMWVQRAENLACRDADLVVSLLPKAEAHLRAHGMAAGKFLYVPNGIDPAEWSDDSAQRLPHVHAAAIQAARAKGDLLVSYAGAHGVANVLDSMLDAAALLRDESVTWLVVGSGPEKAALQQRVVTERLTNVVLLDPLDKAAIPMFLRAMDVLYIGLQSQPLFRFGVSPNKLMDYMMSARPVICAIAAGNDLVGEAGCGVTIAPQDSAALAAAIRHMRQLAPEERERMGQAGRAFVERNHTYAGLAQRFLDAVRGHSSDKQPRR